MVSDKESERLGNIAKTAVKNSLKRIIPTSKKTPMTNDLENIMKSNGGISLWNMDMKNYIWNDKKAEKKYIELWKEFHEGYSNLLDFVNDAEKKNYF